ncbi:MAG: hypothetical protein MI861_10210, partial [Pirellulales bacterium]|nr:hypothetical protein [Pirellulales bacterium]
MNEETTPNEHLQEQAFDVLLGEALGQPGPPDLSHQILARMRDLSDSNPAGIVCTDVSVQPRPAIAATRRPLVIMVSAVVALAASLLLAVVIGQSLGTPDRPADPIANHQDAASEDPATAIATVTDTNPTPNSPIPDQEELNPPIKIGPGIPLVDHQPPPES